MEAEAAPTVYDQPTLDTLAAPQTVELTTPSMATPGTPDLAEAEYSEYGLSRHKRTVNNLVESFSFFQAAVEEIMLSDVESKKKEHGDAWMTENMKSLGLDEDADFISQDLLVDRLQQLTLSTSYSGIGGPEATLNTLHHYVQKVTGRSISRPRVLFQIEFDETCREELMRYAAIDTNVQKSCIFGDLNSFYVKELNEIVTQLKQQPELALEVLAKMVASGEAVKTKSYCYAHQKQCHVPLSDARCMMFLFLLWAQ